MAHNDAVAARLSSKVSEARQRLWVWCNIETDYLEMLLAERADMRTRLGRALEAYLSSDSASQTQPDDINQFVNVVAAILEEGEP